MNNEAAELFIINALNKDDPDSGLTYERTGHGLLYRGHAVVPFTDDSEFRYAGWATIMQRNGELDSDDELEALLKRIDHVTDAD